MYDVCIYSYETIIQDRTTFYPGESETYLSNNINKLLVCYINKKY